MGRNIFSIFLTQTEVIISTWSMCIISAIMTFYCAMLVPFKNCLVKVLAETEAFSLHNIHFNETNSQHYQWWQYTLFFYFIITCKILLSSKFFFFVFFRFYPRMFLFLFECSYRLLLSLSLTIL